MPPANCLAGGICFLDRTWLGRDDVGGLLPLGPVHHLKLHFLTPFVSVLKPEP